MSPRASTNKSAIYPSLSESVFRRLLSKDIGMTPDAAGSQGTVTSKERGVKYQSEVPTNLENTSLAYRDASFPRE